MSIINPEPESEQRGTEKKFSLKNIGIEKLLYVLLAGIALIVIFMPSEETKEASNAPNAPNTPLESAMTETLEVSEETYEKLLEARLTGLLEQADGVGKVQVMITLKSSSEKVVLTERPYTRDGIAETDSEGGNRNTTQISQSEITVYIEGSDGSRVPYIVKELEPSIEGVVVIAEGGGRADIIESITNAVTALFDVPNHKVRVLKMK